MAHTVNYKLWATIVILLNNRFLVNQTLSEGVCREIKLCESSYKSEKNCPSQSSSDFETDL